MEGDSGNHGRGGPRSLPSPSLQSQENENERGRSLPSVRGRSSLPSPSLQSQPFDLDEDIEQHRDRDPSLPPPSIHSRSSTLSSKHSFSHPPVPSFIDRSNTKDSTISQTTTPPMIIPPNPWPSHSGQQTHYVMAGSPQSDFDVNGFAIRYQNRTRSFRSDDPREVIDPVPPPPHLPPRIPAARDEEEPSMASTAGTSRYYEIDFTEGQAQVQRKRRSRSRTPDGKQSSKNSSSSNNNNEVDQLEELKDEEVDSEKRPTATPYFGRVPASRATASSNHASLVTPPESPLAWDQAASSSSTVRGPQQVLSPDCALSDVTAGLLDTTTTGYSASISEGPAHHTHSFSDVSSTFLGPLGSQIRLQGGNSPSRYGSGGVTRTLSMESKLPQLSVAGKSTVTAQKNSTSAVKSKLQEGRFSLDDGSTRRFVYVPSNFSFRTKEGFDAILQALGMAAPDLVFHVGECCSVVPNQNMNEIRAYYQELRPRNHQNSPDQCCEREDLKFPHPGRDYFEILTRHNRVKTILDSVATEIKCAAPLPVFILNAPHRGNELAEFACAVAQQKGIATLGLFFDEEFTCLDANGDDKEEESIAEIDKVDMGQLVHRGFEVPWDKYWSKRRQKVPKDMFKEKEFVTDIDEEPAEVMQIHCERSPSEKAFRENYRFNVIRNGLANSCSHLLVFESKDAKDEFHAIFTKLYSAGLIVAGSNLSELDFAFYCLSNSLPVFVLKGTGATANAVAELVKFGEWIGGLNGNKAAHQLTNPKFVNPMAVDSYIQDNFPPYEKRSELNCDDNIWEYARVLAHTFLGLTTQFNPRSNAVIDVACYVDVNSIQDSINRVISSISERAPELGGPAKDLEALAKARAMMEELAKIRRRQRVWGLFVQLAIRLMLIITVAFGLAQGTAVEKDSKGYNGLRFFTIVLPLISAVLITLEATIRPGHKYALLLLAEKRIESEIYRFRTRTGIYRRGTSNGDHSSSVKSKKLFMERCEAIVETSLESDVSTGSLFSLSIKKENISADFDQEEVTRSTPRRRRARTAVDNRVRDDELSISKMMSTCWPTRKIPPVEPPLGSSSNDEDDSEAGLVKPKLKGDSSAAEYAPVSMGTMGLVHRSVSLTADGYLEQRIVEQLDELQANAPHLACVRIYLKLVVIILTASCSMLASFDAAEWIALPLAIAAALEFFNDYQQLETRIPTINSAAGELVKVWIWWTGLSLAQMRLSSNKDELVDRAERAILAQYEHHAGQMASTFRRRQEHHGSEEAETRPKASPKAENERKRFQEITTARSRS